VKRQKRRRSSDFPTTRISDESEAEKPKVLSFKAFRFFIAFWENAKNGKIGYILGILSRISDVKMMSKSK
jgi:hypothetical protein